MIRLTHPGGRPLKYKSVEELQSAIDKYIDSCKTFAKDKNGDVITDANGEPVKVVIKPITITGLALALGFNSRQSLLNYQDREEFLDAITRAKFLCEDYAVSRLYDKDGVQGGKFNLTNNYGWVEKQEVSSVNTNHNINSEIDTEKFLANATEDEIAKADKMSWAEMQEIINRK